jgi:hypothetical protein
MDRAQFRDVAVHVNLASDATEAAVSLVCELSSPQRLSAAVVTEVTLDDLPVAELEDPITVFGEDTILVQSVTLKRVQLWWPYDLGGQPLYTAKLALVDREGTVLDRRVVTFGVRDAGFSGQADPGELPRLLELNGRQIPVLPGYLIDHELERGEDRVVQLIEAARDAGMTVLLVKDAVLPVVETALSACDRLGIPAIVVLPGETDAGSGFSDLEAEQFALRYRAHPCLVARSGPELYPWEVHDPESRAVRLLRQAVEDEDPRRPLLPAAPVNVMAPADWCFFQYVLEGERRKAKWRVVPAISELRYPDGRERPFSSWVLRGVWARFGVSAAFDLDLSKVDSFRADVWLHNTGPARALLNVVALLRRQDGEELYQESLAAEVDAGADQLQGDLYWRFPESFSGSFELLLEVVDEEGGTLARNRYVLSRPPGSTDSGDTVSQ